MVRGRDELDDTYNFMPFIVIAITIISVKAIY